MNKLGYLKTLWSSVELYEVEVDGSLEIRSYDVDVIHHRQSASPTT
jgi:hypothetical protein